MNDWANSLKATLVGALVGTALGIGAFLILTTHQGMGDALFLFVPVAAGFSVALIARGRNSATAAGLLSVLASLVLLIATGKEGLLCAMLCIPIIFAGLGIGIGLGTAARKLLLRRSNHQTTVMGLLLLFGPTLVLTGDRFERPLLQHPRLERIQSSITVNARPEIVWSNILSIDTIQAPKPWLMYIGLPIPERCTLQAQRVGAKRTCYFNSGYIEETITEWDPPRRMGLVIDRTHMPGRHWLGFESAEYQLEEKANSTVLTRTTVISSHLLPRWYWRTFERLGVESEHRYLLQDVAQRLEASSAQ
jgi:hypothetical protein